MLRLAAVAVLAAVTAAAWPASGAAPWAPASLAAQGPPQRYSGPSSQTLYQIFIDYWEWRLAEEPELATQVGRVEHNGRWTDWSKAARDRRRRAREEYLQQTMFVSTGNLNPQDHLGALQIEYEIHRRLEAQTALDLVQRVSQVDGLHNQVFSVIDQMPARTVADYEPIVTRLEALPLYIDQHLALMQEQLAAGLAQPAVVVDLMLDQVRAQSRPTAAESPLLLAFRRFPQAVPAADQARLRRRAYQAYDRQFVPSWRRLEAFLRDVYRPTARTGVAIESVPDGAAVYAALRRFYTTTSQTAEEIHALGLREVARIEEAMRATAREAGFTGTAADYERMLAAQPGMRFANQAEMLTYARDVVARVQPELPKLFLRLPRMAVGVRPIPPDREASTASNYTGGTADGSRQAWFNMNTYRPAEQVKYRTEALVLHEALPGHHLQQALAREIPNVPEFRRVFLAPAFSEGWALYAESLGPALGTVYRDPATRFGQLASEQFRAVRLVVDTGLHAKGWSRTQAREYFAQHVPSQSIAEVDRYIARPGQALAYKLGELKFKELRARAERALGPRFDVRQFHDVVLRNGTLPLEMLEEQVDAWLAAGAPAAGE
jgi:uncharacterized protein (DUF885 family)